MSYLYTFMQSNLLEWCIYLPLISRTRPSWTWVERAAFVTALNAVTHPIVFFFFMNLPLTYLTNILLAEVFAVVAEAALLIWILKIRARDAGVASLIANLVSWQIAPMLTYAIFAR